MDYGIGNILAAVLVVPYAAFRLAVASREIFVFLRKRPLPSEFSFDGIFYFCVLASVMAVYSAEHPLPPVVQATAIFAWLIGASCDIIREVILRHHEWRMRQVKKVSLLFLFLDRCHDRASEYSRRFIKLSAAALLLVLVASWCNWHSRCVVLFGAAFFLLTLLGLLLRQVDSCRSLLLYWLVGGIVFFVLLTQMLHVIIGAMPNQHPVLDYAVFTLLYANFWCFSIGVSDDDAGKLAAQAVNTITTLLTVLIGLLALYGKREHPNFPWDELQTHLLCSLLPVVISGYLAALFKEVQIYWRKKYRKGGGANSA